MSDSLKDFVRAGPPLQRITLRALLSLSRRPRGRALLMRAPLAAQAGESLIAMARYDDPAVARALGWDADAVMLRGRTLRRAEGRP